jgi:hypothetical protein
MLRFAFATLLLLAAGAASAAPLDDARKQLTERFRALADAHGLTAEVYTRCTKRPDLAKQLRENLDRTGAQLQRETGITTSLKDVADRAFASGKKRGAQLLCSEKPEEFAANMMEMTKNGVNDSIARLIELKQQEQPAKPQ